METQGIFLSWIVVKNLDQALKFYTDTVGLKINEVNREYGWAELSGPGGAMLGIAQENPIDAMKAGSNAVVTISVDNLESAIDKFKKQGVTFVGDILEIPGQVKMQTFLDKDQNRMQLVQQL